jgi:hypothetical protein
VYGISNVYAITNTESLAFVGSHACLTGDFSVDECFGEAWLRKENGGAIAFWGATNLTFWYHDDRLEKAMFDWLFACTDPSPSVGEITDVALAEVEVYYPDEAQYYWEEYHVLGDPSLRFLTESVSAISPCFGSPLSSVPVTIKGSGFCGDVQVRLGSVLLANVTWVNATTLTALVPSGLDLGVYDLMVRNGDGEEVTLLNAYTVIEAPYVYYFPLIWR